MSSVGCTLPAEKREAPVTRRHTRAQEIVVRPVNDGETDALGRIFFRAVREGAARAYSREQRAAWAYAVPSGPEWAQRLTAQSTVVAEVKGRPVGFMTMNLETGYLDLAFVLPEAQGRGVADALYLVLETRARACGLACLSADASHLAKPFFLRHGWTVASSRTALREGVELQNWQMTKMLA